MPAWNDSNERQLLLTIIHTSLPGAPNWERVASLMGDGYTKESTRQHFAKLRKACIAEFGEPDAVANGTPAKATPAKGTPRKPKGAAVNGDTPSKSTGKRKAGMGTDDVDDEEDGSPSKKAAVKLEEDEDSNGVDLS